MSSGLKLASNSRSVPPSGAGREARTGHHLSGLTACQAKLLGYMDAFNLLNSPESWVLLLVVLSPYYRRGD